MSSNRDDFEIAIICALPLEARAVRVIMEDTGGDFGKAWGDINAYTTGKVGNHKVVLVHMPGMGKVPAAAVAMGLNLSFKNIKLALLVGICGGVPSENLMLGDIVIGTEIVHYDFGRQHENNVFRMKKGSEGGPGQRPQVPEIQAFKAQLVADIDGLKNKTFDFLTPMLMSCSSGQVDDLRDVLYPANYWHVHQDPKFCRCRDGAETCDIALESSCEELNCDEGRSIRPTKPKPRPSLHFGSIASGDGVMKSAARRDDIAQKEGVIAFDMEAAGLWDYLPCIPIKGVSDYSDSHKNKRWQAYAAMAAAACAKAVLEQWTPSQEVRAPKTRQATSMFINNDSKIGWQADVINAAGGTFSFS